MALDQLHAEEGAAVGEGSELVDRDDAGVLELAADLGFLDEAAGHVGVVAVVVAEDLEGDLAVEVGVAAFQDRRPCRRGRSRRRCGSGGWGRWAPGRDDRARVARRGWCRGAGRGGRGRWSGRWFPARRG